MIGRKTNLAQTKFVKNSKDFHSQNIFKLRFKKGDLFIYHKIPRGYEFSYFSWKFENKTRALRSFKESYVKSVLGKLPPSPNSNANPKPNSDPDRGKHFSSGAIFRTRLNQPLKYTAQKMKFSLRISSVTVTKSVGHGGFVYIYWRNL